MFVWSQTLCSAQRSFLLSEGGKTDLVEDPQQRSPAYRVAVLSNVRLSDDRPLTGVAQSTSMIFSFVDGVSFRPASSAGSPELTLPRSCHIVAMIFCFGLVL